MMRLLSIGQKLAKACQSYCVRTLWILGLCGMLAGLNACGGGDNARGSEGCSGFCATDSPQHLSQADVQQIIAQAVAEADARQVAASIAVVDRVGNVLAVFDMAGVGSITITSAQANNGADELIAGGLENIDFIPANLGALAKAITGAFLSTEGNAFSTRTANQIIQDHFNPGERNQPAGPLFGVQFSQLACSDLNRRLKQDSGAFRPGPKRSPLGFSADPGGFPLYKNGSPVGGVGIMADGIYGLDKDLSGPVDRNIDELIAIAALSGFEAPVERIAERITVDGKVFRYSDAQASQLLSQPTAAVFSGPDGVEQRGSLVGINGYYQVSSPPAPAVDILEGVRFGQTESGVVSVANAPGEAKLSSTTVALFAEQDAFVLLDEQAEERFPPMAGTDEQNLPDSPVDIAPLSQSEVETILQEALRIAARGRAQIRRPLSSPIAVSISIVDTNGTILGLVRTRDAPMFGIDVAIQKARTATLFSGGPRNSDGSSVAERLSALPDGQYLNEKLVDAAPVLRQSTPNTIAINSYVNAARSFLESPTALADGATAFADRSGGNLSRPYFPDGIDANDPGPFSKPAGEWSVFSNGLQLDLVYNAIVRHVAFLFGLAPDVGGDCAAAGAPRGQEASRALRTDECRCVGVNAGIADGLGDSNENLVMPEIANGIQIFPGSVPIYRGNQLIGGIGISGDGVDQDDMIAFLGLHNASIKLAAAGHSNPAQNAPLAMRADQLTPLASDGERNRLRYINCPQSPFRDSDEQEVCDGK